jgi:protoporphyrinogen/coproporphyrinogen III oxidase
VNTAEGPRDAVVVGAGIGGLATAWDLRDRDVLVLEAADRLGGRVHSEPRGSYWLNLGAHVFSGPGSATWRLADEVGVELRKVPGQLVAVELNGRIVAGGRPELFPFRLPLGLRDRVALIRAGLRLKRAVAGYERVARPRTSETPADTRRRVLAYGDDRTFADWLGPLSGDAAALFRATVTRSTAELDEIAFGHGAGYFSLVWNAGKGLSHNVLGGPGRLIEGIAAGLSGRVVTNAEVYEVVTGVWLKPDPSPLVRVRYRENGSDREVLARHVVLATKAFDAARIAVDLAPETRASLAAIPYGPSVVMAIVTGESVPMPWDELYALATPKRSFSMLFNIVNVLRPASAGSTAGREPGGSLMVYRSGSAALDLMERSDSEIEQAFLDDLYAIFPAARGIVKETVLARMPRMLPYAFPGRAALQPALEQPLGRVHLAGDYLGGVYTETAISSGQGAAAEIRAALERELSRR